jgi:hypothetical protein
MAARQFRHSKLDSLTEKEKPAFLTQCIKLWFRSHNSYYKLSGLTSEHKLTQHCVKLESFYDAVQPVLESIHWTILPFAKFKCDIILSEKSKKLLSDRIFMTDLNRYLDEILRSIFNSLIVDEKGLSTTVVDARAKAFDMADSDDLWT